MRWFDLGEPKKKTTGEVYIKYSDTSADLG
jgi:hypothetical protein